MGAARGGARARASVRRARGDTRAVSTHRAAGASAGWAWAGKTAGALHQGNPHPLLLDAVLVPVRATTSDTQTNIRSSDKRNRQTVKQTIGLIS